MPPKVGYGSTFAVDTLHASAARTASGNGTPVTGFGKVTQFRAQLNVTAVSGTAPTLDVVIEDSIDGTNWNVIGTFAQDTAVGREVINITSPFADQVRVRYVIGGTTPSFTFSVLVHSQ